MRQVSWKSLTAALLTAVLFGGVCAAAQSAADYVIGAQDVLAITVYDQTGLTGKYTVETDGTFTFPLLGRVKAAGLTLRQFEAELKKQLGDGFLINPQVAVGVEQYRSQRVFILGEVRQPGSYPLTGGMTLVEALATAGLGAAGSGDVIIVRPRDTKRPASPQDPAAEVITVAVKALQTGEMSQNVALRDGDTIFVPRAETVYVFGQVRNPGSYGVQQGTTVLQALSLAGGATANAALGRIRIVRLVDGNRKELKVKLSDVVKPGDTIIVPERFF